MSETITIRSSGGDRPLIVQHYLDAGYSIPEADRIVNLLIDFELNRVQSKVPEHGERCSCALV